MKICPRFTRIKAGFETEMGLMASHSAACRHPAGQGQRRDGGRHQAAHGQSPHPPLCTLPRMRLTPT